MIIVLKFPLVIDTETLSSFAWIKRMDILETLYSGKMSTTEIILVHEICVIQHIFRQVQNSIHNNHINIIGIEPYDKIGIEYSKLISGKYGRGEASCMAYLKYNEGTLVSNDLKDVKYYCEKHNIDRIGTPHILYDYYQNHYMTEAEGNIIWEAKLKKKRRLPANTFSEVIQFFESGKGKTIY